MSGDFEKRECNKRSNTCDCEIDVYKKDTNISLVYNGNHRLTMSDENMKCLRTDLFIYKHKISLDDIYKRHIRNKTLAYMSGLSEYSYKEKSGIITLMLTYINSAINSSRPTTHEYTFVYDKKKRKVIGKKFRFIDE